MTVACSRRTFPLAVTDVLNPVAYFRVLMNTHGAAQVSAVSLSLSLSLSLCMCVYQYEK